MQEPSEPIPFELHGTRKLVLVKVHVNGKLSTFVVDTGATFTVVNARVLELQSKLPEAELQGSQAGMRAVATHATADLRLGTSHWPKRTVVAMNLTQAEEFYGQRIDGLLGQDIMQEFRKVVFDYETKTLLLVR